MQRNLEGRIALITGSDSGIGQATAVECARAGANVAIVYFEDRDGAESTARQVTELGAKNVVVQADVSLEADVNRLFDECERSLGAPAILVNSAGVDASGIPIDELPLETWRRAIDTNLTGPFLCCRRFVRLLKRQKLHGRIVNISSVHQDIPRAGAVEYDCSKGGLRNLTTTLGLELAPLKINVNGIAPGMVLTPMNQASIDDPKELEKQVQSIPWKRAAEPVEVARLVVYLCSDDADYITGSTFVIDGGLMLNQGQGA